MALSNCLGQVFNVDNYIMKPIFFKTVEIVYEIFNLQLKILFLGLYGAALRTQMFSA